MGALSGDFTINLARQCRVFSSALKIEKLKAPLFRGPEGTGASNDWCISNTNTVTAIRLPPYYAELNSNELIWAMLKGKVARSNLMFKKDTDTASDCVGGSIDDERTPTASEGHEAS